MGRVCGVREIIGVAVVVVLRYCVVCNDGDIMVVAVKCCGDGVTFVLMVVVMMVRFVVV